MIEFYVGHTCCRISMGFPAAVIVMLSLGDTAFALACLLASLLHEGGHFFAMALVHDHPSRLYLGAFGARVERRRDSAVGYGGRALVSLSGPLVNLIAAVLLYATGGLTQSVWIHGVLGCFNLLPVLSLDGGEALYTILCMILSEQRAHTMMLILSAVILMPLAILGFLMLLIGGYNFSLMILAVYLILLLIFKEKH